MLEGLEIKEFNYSETIDNKDFRIDSDFWTKEPYQNPALSYDKIGNHLKKSQYGISISMNEDGVGCPIYRMNEIHNMLCDLNVLKCADVSSSDKERFTLKNKDVVFNRTNSYEWVGRTGVYYKKDNADYIFASYLVRFIPDSKTILPEYLATFLNTKYGVQDVKRRSRHSINQTNVNPEEVKEIEIPLLPIGFQKYIEAAFSSANQARLTSHEVYEKAKHALLKELGLSGFIPSDENKNIKTFSESFLSSGRLDAEYYQPKFEEVVDHIKTTSHDILDNVVKIKKSIEPGSAHYSEEEGTPFLRVADYDKYGLSEPSKKLNSKYCIENADKLKKLKPKKGTILFSKDGSVGMAYHLREDKDLITSGAILHLTVRNPKEVVPEYLTLVLNSLLVQMQAERDAGGSIILHWRVGEIENVVVPIIDYKKQEEIAELVEESFALKVKSEGLLEIAKRAVEIAIEEDEKAAEKYIHDQCSELGVDLKED